MIARALLAATAIATGCSMAALAAPTNYQLLTTVSLPVSGANSQGGKLTGFDISYVDPVTGYYYFADRSNAGVDIINGANNHYVARAGGFVGQLGTTSVSGPDGVLVVDNGSAATLYAGDGGSLLRSFNVTNPSNPIPTGTVSTNGGAFRVDEMAYSPSSQLLFAANNANTPAYGSLISTATASTPALSIGNVLVPGQVASGGLEQPVWNPSTGTFFVSVPNFKDGDAGGVQEFSTTGQALRTFDFTSTLGANGCNSAGLALGSNGNLMVGCATAGTQTVVLNPATGAITKLAGVSGSDELWYDPGSNEFFVTGVDASGDRVIDVFDGSTYGLLQSIDLTKLGAGTGNLHSVAVDPLNGNVFVPLLGSNGDTLCAAGCVAVFSQKVPEPGSMAVLAAGLMGLVGWSVRAQRRG